MACECYSSLFHVTFNLKLKPQVLFCKTPQSCCIIFPITDRLRTDVIYWKYCIVLYIQANAAVKYSGILRCYAKCVLLNNPNVISVYMQLKGVWDLVLSKLLNIHIVLVVILTRRENHVRNLEL